MEQITNEIRAFLAGQSMGDVLGPAAGRAAPFTKHYTQGEELFYELAQELEVPHFPIHHDVRDTVPSRDYLGRVHEVLARAAALAPQVLAELAWFFDPGEILKPCLFRVYRVEESLYLYLLRIDLTPRPLEATVLERGTNDLTPHYRTRRLFLEPVIIPLADVAREEGRVSAFRIQQLVSQTWIGELGRGYFQQGIWMDLDLTKFFSRLFLPAGSRLYPFYPFLCRYRTVCHAPLDLSPEGRLEAVPRLHRAIGFLRPVMTRVEQVMRHGSFTEDLALFQELKATVPADWCRPWQGIRIEMYLNHNDAREYRVHEEPQRAAAPG